MEKINFEEGQKVSNGYVEIDGVQHEVVEAEYSGNTPLSAHVLNKMQDNIENEIVLETTTTKDVQGEELTIQDSANAKGQIFFEGKTIQEGTGDASPNNIRNIRNVGDNINLFDKSKAETLGYYNSSNTFASSTVYNYFEFIPELNTDYTIKTTNKFSNNVYFVGFDSEGNTTLITNFSSNEVTFNSSDYVKIGYSVHKDDFDNCKLEKSSTPTGYSPYGCGCVDIKAENEDKTQSKTIQFLLSEGQVLHQGDYLAEDGIHQKRGIYIFTGNETFIKHSTTSNNAFYCQMRGLIGTNVAIPTSNTETTTLVCSHFDTSRAVNSIVFTDTTGTMLTKTDTSGDFQLYMCMGLDGVSTITNLKTWLAEQYANGTPVIVEYELAEEIIVPYTEEQKQALKPELFKGYNYISCIDEIKPNMNLTYYTNNNINNTYAKRIDKLEAKILELEELLTSQTSELSE